MTKPTPEQVLSDLDGHLKYLETRVYQLALDDDLFWSLNEVVRHDSRFGGVPDDLLVFIRYGYLTKSIVGLRALVDRDKRSRSADRLFAQICSHIGLFDRAWYRTLYAPGLRDMADSTFAKFAGGPQNRIPVAELHARRASLKSAVTGAVDYANDHVTHWSKNPGAEPLLYTDLRRAIAVSVDTVLDLGLLLRGARAADLLPTRQYNWEDVLRFAWLPPGKPLPQTPELRSLLTP